MLLSFNDVLIMTAPVTMINEIISYMEMCRREGLSLQKGMNFAVGRRPYSIILLSRQPGAPYTDQFCDDGTTLIYEGHDVPKSTGNPRPKTVDQEQFLPSGNLTENGKFFNAAAEYKAGKSAPHKVKAYEKLKAGIWLYNGVFNLIDAWLDCSSDRKVFKFKLMLADEQDHEPGYVASQLEHNRLIPSQVKFSVWQRDNGKCVKCSASDNLHFDHIIPYSKGGSSLTPENIQLLCCRHNLQKRDTLD